MPSFIQWQLWLGSTRGTGWCHRLMDWLRPGNNTVSPSLCRNVKLVKAQKQKKTRRRINVFLVESRRNKTKKKKSGGRLLVCLVSWLSGWLVGYQPCYFLLLDYFLSLSGIHIIDKKKFRKRPKDKDRLNLKNVAIRVLVKLSIICLYNICDVTSRTIKS